MISIENGLKLAARGTTCNNGHIAMSLPEWLAVSLPAMLQTRDQKEALLSRRNNGLNLQGLYPSS